MITFIFKGNASYYRIIFKVIEAKRFRAIERQKSGRLICIYNHRAKLAIYKSGDYQSCQADLTLRIRRLIREFMNGHC